MKTYDSVPEHREKFAKPTTMLPSNPKEQLELLDRADSVLLASRAKISPDVRERIWDRFWAGQSFSDRYRVYIRRNP